MNSILYNKQKYICKLSYILLGLILNVQLLALGAISSKDRQVVEQMGDLIYDDKLFEKDRVELFGVFDLEKNGIAFVKDFLKDDSISFYAVKNSDRYSLNSKLDELVYTILANPILTSENKLDILIQGYVGFYLENHSDTLSGFSLDEVCKNLVMELSKYNRKYDKKEFMVSFLIILDEIYGSSISNHITGDYNEFIRGLVSHYVLEIGRKYPLEGLDIYVDEIFIKYLVTKNVGIGGYNVSL